jgi:acetyl esterase/lipase
VPYGDHPNQVIDFRKANVEKPAPLVVFIHGGGFTGGSHDKVNAKAVQQYLDAGIHHASIEYRFLKHADFPAAHYSLFAQKQRNGELIKIELLDMEDLRGHSLLPT